MSRRFSDRRGPRGGGSFAGTGKGTFPTGYGVGTSALALLGSSGAGSVWTPLSLPSLKLWLRADLGVTGTSPVTAWADQSGQGNNATGSGTLVLSASGGPNSQACIQKPATGYLVVPYAVGLHPTVAVAAIIVWRWSGASRGSNGGILCTASSSAWSDGWNIVNGPAATNGLVEAWVNAYNTHYTNNSTPDHDSTSWFATSVVYDSSVPSLDRYDSNVAATNKVATAGNGVIAYSTSSQLVIAGYTTAGGAGAVVSAPAMDIAEVMVCGATLASGDRTQLQSYINTRYGL